MPHLSCCCCCHLVVKSCPAFLEPCGLQPTRLLCLWDCPGKNMGVGRYVFLQPWVTSFSSWWYLLLQSRGSRAIRLQQLWLVGSVVLVPELQSTGLIVGTPGLSCPMACEIFLDQGPNLCPRHWQVDSSPLSHQGSPTEIINVLFSMAKEKN